MGELLGPHQTSDFRDAVVSASLYVNNWWLILRDVSYFQAFGTPAPLNHLWSLSIEEQFYIAWPFLLALGIRFVPGVSTSTGGRVRLAVVTLGMACASAIAMAILYQPGVDPSRVYYGTDTRCLALLVGAALALVLPSRRLRADISAGAARAVDGLGIAGLVVIAWMLATCDEQSTFLYRGGFMLLSIATALVVAAFVHPAGRLGGVVGCRGVRWIGERSYGIYLWHYPIIVLTTPAGARGVDTARATAQVLATIAIAALSWHVLEDPIRRGAIARLAARVRANRHRHRLGMRRRRPRPNLAQWAASSGGLMLVLVAMAGLAGAGMDRTPTVTGNVTIAKTVSHTAAAAERLRLRRASQTTCRPVVHVGDSTSEGLVTDVFLRDSERLISNWYSRVGATTQHFEISAARSIFERFKGQPNARDVAAAWKSRDFRGCWVLALGTNEAANVAAGSKFTLDQRIDAMMSTIGAQPTLWVNVKTLVTAGAYADVSMAAWNRALTNACSRYPQMRVFDWASAARDEWFIADGIHFTTDGYSARGRLIAGALLGAFPGGGTPSRPRSGSCVVSPRPVPEPPPLQNIAPAGSQTASTPPTAPIGPGL